MVRSGQLADDTLASLRRVVLGVLCGSSIGALLAVVTGATRLGRLLVPIVELIRPIPPVALVPFAILWLGLGDTPAIFLVAFGSAFPVYSSVGTGLVGVRASQVEAALSLGASRRLLISDVLIPASLPQILSGLRVAVGTGWFCVIVAELVGAQDGLGYRIQLSRLTLQMEQMLVCVAAVGLVGFGMNRLLQLLDRKLTPWRRGALEVR